MAEEPKALPVKVSISAHLLAEQRQRRGVLLSEPSNNEKLQLRLGSSLTPQVISAILRRADQGQMDSIADMLDEVRETDPHLHSVLFKREAQVAGAPWEIRPPRSSPGARKSKGRKPKIDPIIQFVTETIENLPHFSQTLAHLQGANYHGRAAAEIMWVRAQNGKILPDCIEPIHARRLSYAAQNWKLHLWDVSGSGIDRFGKYPGVPFDEFPKGKFIVHTPRLRGTYPTREGLGRNLVWYSVFKRWTQRDWMALAEMSGRPGRVGYYSTGADGKPEATPEDVELLKAALINWSSSVSVSLPDTVKMDFVNATSGQSELHKVLIDHCNSEISKCVLGETLTTEAGTRGARSLGDVHDDVRLMIALWDAKAIAETLRYCLIAPLVRMNFGEKALVPEIVFTVAPDEDLNALATRYKLLAEAGLDMDQEYIRDVFGIPEPVAGVKLMIPRAPARVLADGSDTPQPLAGQGRDGDGDGDRDEGSKGTGQPSGGPAGGEEKPESKEVE